LTNEYNKDLADLKKEENNINNAINKLKGEDVINPNSIKSSFDNAWID
jgi:copper chaperone CopZ